VGVDSPSVTFLVLDDSDGRCPQFAIDMTKQSDTTESPSSNTGHVGVNPPPGTFCVLNLRAQDVIQKDQPVDKK
jgi:hypothetical protein